MFKTDLSVHQPATFTFCYPVVFDKEPKVGSIFFISYTGTIIQNIQTQAHIFFKLIFKRHKGLYKDR